MITAAYKHAVNTTGSGDTGHSRTGPRMWGRASSVSASAEVRNLFNTWANQLLLRIAGN